MATQVYLLVQDGKNSRALLALLEYRDRMRFVSASTPPDSDNMLDHLPLILIRAI